MITQDLLLKQAEKIKKCQQRLLRYKIKKEELKKCLRLETDFSEVLNGKRENNDNIEAWIRGHDKYIKIEKNINKSQTSYDYEKRVYDIMLETYIKGE